MLSSTLVSVNKNTNLGPAQQDRSRDLLFVLCDILSYRFISYPFPVGSKVHFSHSFTLLTLNLTVWYCLIFAHGKRYMARLDWFRLPNYFFKVNLMLWCYTALGNSQVQMNIALCSALEQVMLRYWMWNSPQEMFYLSNAFLGLLIYYFILFIVVCEVLSLRKFYFMKFFFAISYFSCCKGLSHFELKNLLT